MRDIMDRLSIAVKKKMDKSSTATAIRRKSGVFSRQTTAIIDPGSGDSMKAEDFKLAFCRRIKHAREDRGLSQTEMAVALGIKKDRYVKYENRSPMPAMFIERFSRITGKDIEFLITGRQADRPRTGRSNNKPSEQIPTFSR